MPRLAAAATLNRPDFNQPGRVLGARANRTNRTRIKQDSIFLKIACCVPVFGWLGQYIVEKQINKKIEQVNPFDRQLLAKLIRVKNDFKKCGIVRDCIHIAMSVASIGLMVFALGIIPAIQPALFSTFMIAFLGFSVKVAIDDIKRNNKSIQMLKNGISNPCNVVVR